jgi:micrococcal nuclease
MRYWILAIFILIASHFPAWAEASMVQHLPEGNFAELRKGAPSRVSQIIDPMTLALDDKTILRLSGIEIPDNNPYKPGNFAITALKILRDMLEGKTIDIFQVKKNAWGQSNRMGQQLAHIARQSDQAWVQGALLELGLARVMTDARNPEMAAQMYVIEQRARASKIGIWSNEAYRILTPDTLDERIGAIQIVEGKIHSVSTKQNRIFLNFGPDWRTDFTVVIAPENRKQFFDRNIDPLKSGQKTIRVRGWVGEYNGPYIEVDHPERIELLD